MTQEEKQLLIKDLCGRLPYGVMCDFAYNLGNPQKLLYVTPYDEKEQIHLGAKEYKFGNGPYGPSDFDVEHVKIYLRPMSSMTEEEIEEYRNLSDEVIGSYGPYHREFIAHCVRLGIKPGNPHECVDEFLNMEAIDWLNEHHFDYRGLIEKGLALEAPEGMYKTE